MPKVVSRDPPSVDLAKESLPIANWNELFYPSKEPSESHKFGDLLRVLRESGYEKPIGQLVVDILKFGIT